MAKRQKASTLTLECRYGKWILSGRGGPDGVIQADGRSNRIDFGRHSLGVRDMNEAKRIVHDLDLRMAVKFGLAEPRVLHHRVDTGLTIDRGLTPFKRHMERPKAVGGLKDSTRKRYCRAIRTIERFASIKNVRFWEQVNEDLLNEYATWRLESCTQCSVVTELQVFRQIHRFLVDRKHLSGDFSFPFQLRRPKETSRYCPSSEELAAILKELASNPNHKWLYDVCTLLAFTGQRLGELSAMTWDDVEILDTEEGEREGFFHIRDESSEGENARSTKTGYSRLIPIHDSAMRVIESLKKAATDNLLLHGPRGGSLRCDTFADHLRLHALQPLSDRFTHKRFQSITAHCFRHYFASLCAASNISQQTVMDWMGHRTDAMAKRYFHRDNEASLRNIKKLKAIDNVPPINIGDTIPKPEQSETDDSEAGDTDGQNS
jgi:integrase